MKYWLLKTEPSTFSFEDLLERPGKTEKWDGVRTYQARNFLRDDFKKGDLCLIYHSRLDEPGVTGIAVVASEGYPDPSALDPKSPYFDEKSLKDKKSRWTMVDVTAKEKLVKFVTLSEIRKNPKLQNMLLLKKGQRLSIQPMDQAEFEEIMRMGRV